MAEMVLLAIGTKTLTDLVGRSGEVSGCVLFAGS
jgi:hypothetical protein